MRILGFLLKTAVSLPFLLAAGYFAIASVKTGMFEPDVWTFIIILLVVAAMPWVKSVASRTERRTIRAVMVGGLALGIGSLLSAYLVGIGSVPSTQDCSAELRGRLYCEFFSSLDRHFGAGGVATYLGMAGFTIVIISALVLFKKRLSK